MYLNINENLIEFKTYRGLLEFCVNHRSCGLEVLNQTGPYTPFVFGDLKGVITLYAGYKVIKDLTKLLKPRRTGEYKAWRKAVLARDDFRCVECGRKAELAAHHVEHVARNPGKATELENGITLCRGCHIMEHAK